MEIYEKIVKVVSGIIAICLMAALWQIGEVSKTAQRYPVKEEEYVSLENYALETAKTMKKDINISKEEIARRKNDNYRVVGTSYSNNKFFVKVESDIAEVEATIPVTVIGKGIDVDSIDFKMIFKYDETTYTRKATVHPLIIYIGLFVFATGLFWVMSYYILYFIGAGISGIILLIKWIVQKIKKQ